MPYHHAVPQESSSGLAIKKPGSFPALLAHYAARPALFPSVERLQYHLNVPDHSAQHLLASASSVLTRLATSFKKDTASYLLFWHWLVVGYRIVRVLKEDARLAALPLEGRCTLAEAFTVHWSAPLPFLMPRLAVHIENGWKFLHNPLGNFVCISGIIDALSHPEPWSLGTAQPLLSPAVLQAHIHALAQDAFTKMAFTPDNPEKIGQLLRTCGAISANDFDAQEAGETATWSPDRQVQYALWTECVRQLLLHLNLRGSAIAGHGLGDAVFAYVGTYAEQVGKLQDLLDAWRIDSACADAILQPLLRTLQEVNARPRSSLSDAQSAVEHVAHTAAALWSAVCGRQCQLAAQLSVQWQVSLHPTHAAFAVHLPQIFGYLYGAKAEQASRHALRPR